MRKKGRENQALGSDLAAMSRKTDELNSRGAVILKKVKDLREIVAEIESELEWFRQKEPLLLDSLSSKVLESLLSDDERRWTTTDLGILIDKRRLLRGASTVNLSSLMNVIGLAEEAEMRRLGGVKEPNPEPKGGSDAAV